jgi:hypothetical protein
VSTLIVPSEPRALQGPLCPDCCQLTRYNGESARVYCPDCGWSVTLTPDEAGDYVDALVGVTDMDLGLFLQLVAGQRVAA